MSQSHNLADSKDLSGRVGRNQNDLSFQSCNNESVEYSA